MKFTLERVSWFSSREIYRSPGTGFDPEMPYQIRKFPGPRLKVSLRLSRKLKTPAAHNHDGHHPPSPPAHLTR